MCFWAESDDFERQDAGEVFRPAQQLRLSERNKKMSHNSIRWLLKVWDMKSTLWSVDLVIQFQGCSSQLDAYIVRIQRDCDNRHNSAVRHENAHTCNRTHIQRRHCHIDKPC